MSLRVAVPRWPEVQLEWLHNYHDRLHDAGLESVDVTDASLGLRDCDGLLLTGGVDVDPALYNERLTPMTQTPVPARDAMELTLLRQALEQDLPVLAICRGLQLLNVCLGGSLLQHIDNGCMWPARTARPGTRSRLKRGTKLHGVLGAKRVVVNSRHHQAVTPDRLAPGLRITAMSDDGAGRGRRGPIAALVGRRAMAPGAAGG